MREETRRENERKGRGGMRRENEELKRRQVEEMKWENREKKEKQARQNDKFGKGN